LDVHYPIEEIKAELIYILLNDMPDFFYEEAIETIRTWGFVSVGSF
jgi:hypothetical protein